MLRKLGRGISLNYEGDPVKPYGRYQRLHYQPRPGCRPALGLFGGWVVGGGNWHDAAVLGRGAPLPTEPVLLLAAMLDRRERGYPTCRASGSGPFAVTRMSCARTYPGRISSIVS